MSDEKEKRVAEEKPLENPAPRTAKADKLTWPGGNMVYPVPAVMVSCGTAENPNVFTAAWTGTVCSDPAMTFVSIRPSRYSYGLIKEGGDFVINLTTRALAGAADTAGVRSGRDVDKFSLLNLTVVASDKVASPLIAESPVNIECRVTQIIPLGSHDMFLATVEAVHVDASLVDETGRLCLEKADLTVYSHGQYYSLGQSLGSFGFSVRKDNGKKKSSFSGKKRK